MPPRHRPALSSPPLGFAHRGGAALWPENTLVAFSGALELGVLHLESDLHATRDGVLVLHHDDRVDRTTNGTGFIRELTLAELSKLDAGYRFTKDGVHFPYRGAGLTVPTLEQAVALDSSVCFNVEIKQREPDIVPVFWRFLRDNALVDRFIVAAADDALVRRFRAISEGAVATSAGTREVVRFWALSRLGLTPFQPPPFDALQVPEKSGVLRVVDSKLMAAAHRCGVQVHVWTVDDPVAMRRLLDAGVDGLMSDRPDLLHKVLEERTDRPKAPCRGG